MTGEAVIGINFHHTDLMRGCLDLSCDIQLCCYIQRVGATAVIFMALMLRSPLTVVLCCPVLLPVADHITGNVKGGAHGFYICCA